MQKQKQKYTHTEETDALIRGAYRSETRGAVKKAMADLGWGRDRITRRAKTLGLVLQKRLKEEPKTEYRAGPSPCDTCEQRRQCAAGLACGDFELFVDTNKSIQFDRRPGRGAFARVFNE